MMGKLKIAGRRLTVLLAAAGSLVAAGANPAQAHPGEGWHAHGQSYIYSPDVGGYDAEALISYDYGWRGQAYFEAYGEKVILRDGNLSDNRAVGGIVEAYVNGSWRSHYLYLPHGAYSQKFDLSFPEGVKVYVRVRVSHPGEHKNWNKTAGPYYGIA